MSDISNLKSQKWVNLAIRLQQVARTQHLNHYKLLRVSIITTDSGDPIIWSEPEVTRIDPFNGARSWLNQL